MGTQIGALLTKNAVTYEDLTGKIIAIDASNTIHQFLSAIRQKDGSLLTDSSGNPTSHLTGMFSRVTKLRDSGVKPVFVFDGKPPEMKWDTLLKRKAIKEEAIRNYELAKESGNQDDMKKYGQATSRMTPEIVDESKHLLDLMGIPWVQAESEAEAQAAYMVTNSDADFVGSQDYDAFLFGAENVVRNLGTTGKRKVPGKNTYVERSLEHVCLTESLEKMAITREQLIDIAICIGTDFNEGIHRVGAKTALKLINKHQNIVTLLKEEEKDIRSGVPAEEIQEFFLNPPVTTDYELKWSKPDSSELYSFLVEEHDFSEKQVMNNTKILEEQVNVGCQVSLFDF